MVARRNWTRQWFDAALLGRDQVVTSLATIAELEAGDFPEKAAALQLFEQLPLVDLNDSVAEIVDSYLTHKLMPNDPGGDALHLAAASFHRCDFLVTWNCRHLANANKFGHIRRVNDILVLCHTLIVGLAISDEVVILSGTQGGV